MKQTYGTKNRRKEPSLAKIIVAILLVGGGVLGVVRFTQWFTADQGSGGVEESLPVSSLDQARALLAENKTTEAAALLAPILAEGKDSAVMPQVLMLQAELEIKEGKTEAALEHLRSAAEDYSNSPDQPAAAVAYGRLLEQHGNAEQSLEVFAKVKESAPPEMRAPALTALARQKDAAGVRTEAQALYRQALADSAWGSPDWLEAAAGLGRINVAAIFSPDPMPDSRIYSVETGDSLTNIGIKLNTTQGLLERANGISNPNTLRLGQKLKYTPKDFRIIVERSTCLLYLFDSDGLFKVYRVGLGKPSNPTTLGRYKIGNKEKDPTWFKPGSEPIPPLDPRNELGTRWMPLVPEEEGLPTDLGIHGTIQPDSIGKYESMGCPRLLKEEVEELYDLIVRSTPVTIVDKYVPNENG